MILNGIILNISSNHYLNKLRKFYNVTHVSVERASAGPAIKTMFSFFYERMKVTSPLVTKADEIRSLKNEDIIESGLVGKCEVSKCVLELFLTIYGASAGNFSLATLPTGGLYFIGSLSIALESQLKNNVFQVII